MKNLVLTETETFPKVRNFQLYQEVYITVGWIRFTVLIYLSNFRYDSFQR